MGKVGITPGMHSMNISVRFFAHLRERTTQGELILEVSQDVKVLDLKEMLASRYPQLGNTLDNVITSINRKFATDDDTIPAGAEVAFFPPVSGGSGDLALVTEEEIQVDSIVRQMTKLTTGGISFFTGIVRGKTIRNQPKETTRLFYEAYPEMAVEKIEQIIQEIKIRWTDIENVVIIQRLGELLPGDTSVLVACSSSHRDTGIFDAVHYGIDRLKEIVPVWKKEITPDGEQWVEGSYYPKPGE